jgi:cob(I)alamin adenosyltransferase
MQFLKTHDSGELKSLEKLGISVIRKETVTGFFNQLSDEQKETLKGEVEYEFELAKKFLPQYDMVVLDEIFGAVENGLVSVSALKRLIRKKPQGTELIHELKKLGYDLPSDCLSIEECVDALCELLGGADI